MQKKIIAFTVLILFLVIPLHIPFHIHYDTDDGHGCIFCHWEQYFSGLNVFIFSVYFFFTVLLSVIFRLTYFYYFLSTGFNSIRAPPEVISYSQIQ
ncbi:MAG: hypothetical protein ABRQ39_01595 [Candidatus Eremiobacterota bacterium]